MPPKGQKAPKKAKKGKKAEEEGEQEGLENTGEKEAADPSSQKAAKPPKAKVAKPAKPAKTVVIAHKEMVAKPDKTKAKSLGIRRTKAAAIAVAVRKSPRKRKVMKPQR